MEQESDVVIYLWERGPDDHVALLTKKSRNGEEGEVPFLFEKQYSRMSEIGEYARVLTSPSCQESTTASSH